MGFFCPLKSNMKITADGNFGLCSDPAAVFEEYYHTQNPKSQAVIYWGSHIAIGRTRLCWLRVRYALACTPSHGLYQGSKPRLSLLDNFYTHALTKWTLQRMEPHKAWTRLSISTNYASSPPQDSTRRTHLHIAFACVGNNGAGTGGTDGTMKDKNEVVQSIHPAPAAGKCWKEDPEWPGRKAFREKPFRDISFPFLPY